MLPHPLPGPLGKAKPPEVASERRRRVRSQHWEKGEDTRAQAGAWPCLLQDSHLPSASTLTRWLWREGGTPSFFRTFPEATEELALP